MGSRPGSVPARTPPAPVVRSTSGLGQRPLTRGRTPARPVRARGRTGHHRLRAHGKDRERKAPPFRHCGSRGGVAGAATGPVGVKWRLAKGSVQHLSTESTQVATTGKQTSELHSWDTPTALRHHTTASASVPGRPRAARGSPPLSRAPTSTSEERARETTAAGREGAPGPRSPGPATRPSGRRERDRAERRSDPTIGPDHGRRSRGLVSVPLESDPSRCPRTLRTVPLQ